MLRFFIILCGALIIVLLGRMDNIAINALGVILGLPAIIAGLFVHYNRPHHRVIIRSGLGNIVDWPDGRIFLCVPLVHRLAESFDLSWRIAETQDLTITTLEGLLAHITVRVGFTVDPALMDDQKRQVIVDQMGDDAERWVQYIQKMTRAGLNLHTHQIPYAGLTSQAGHRALQDRLTVFLHQLLAGMGVTIMQVLIIQVSPSAQIVDIRADMLRRRALVDFIARDLAPTLGLLMPYTNNPWEALTAIGLLDRLSNRTPGPVTLNMMPVPGYYAGAAPAANTHAPIPLALPHPRHKE